MIFMVGIAGIHRRAGEYLWRRRCACESHRLTRSQLSKKKGFRLNRPEPFRDGLTLGHRSPGSHTVGAGRIWIDKNASPQPLDK